MNKKEKLSVFKASVGAYTVSSFIAWLKHDGLQFINQEEAYVLKFHKSLGIIDVMRFDGHLKKMEIFGDDGMLFVVGMFSAGIAVLVIKGIKHFKEPEKKSSPKGMTVKYNRAPRMSRIRDFEN